MPSASVSSPRRVRTICVYCGSSPATDPVYDDGARALGEAIVGAGARLVYGGGGNGLMGVLARTVLDRGGRATGIIPDFLHRRDQFEHPRLDNVIVPDMHARKRQMFEAADAFVALPGGIGTLEELVEQLSWVQLERHTKPVLLADIDGFWRPFLALLDHMRELRFIRPQFEVRYLVSDRMDRVMPMLETAIADAESTGRRKDTVDPRL